jgi:DNA-binding MarR family transcriptional regulator
MEIDAMATGERSALLWEVASAIARFQSATDLVDEAAAQHMGINRTDLRCVGLLYDHGPMHAGRLGAAAELSPGATTVAIDRLERASYVRRVRAGADRRTVVIELTAEARARLETVYGPVGRAGMERLARYGDAELRLLHEFLVAGYRLQVEQAARIRGLSDLAAGGPQREA